MSATYIVPHAARLAECTDPSVLRLQAAAENALVSALRLIRSLDCDPAQLHAATTRAARAAVALRQLDRAMNPA